MILTENTTSVFAQDVWKYKVVEVNKPSLTEIRISFALTLNGSDYAYDEIRVSPSELDGMTLNQKKAYLNNKVKVECTPYIKTYNVANGLEVLVGQEFNAEATSKALNIRYASASSFVLIFASFQVILIKICNQASSCFFFLSFFMSH